MKTLYLALISLVFLNACSHIPFVDSKAVETSEQNQKDNEANIYLWQASLHKLNFMKIIQQDRQKGIIVTDWYQSCPQAKERYKLEVYISSPQLRSDVISVKGNKAYLANGQWHEEVLSPKMAQIVELSILQKAKQLYQKSFNQ